MVVVWVGQRMCPFSLKRWSRNRGHVKGCLVHWRIDDEADRSQWMEQLLCWSKGRVQYPRHLNNVAPHEWGLTRNTHRC